jgi:hypothetical protein
MVIFGFRARARILLPISPTLLCLLAVLQTPDMLHINPGQRPGYIQNNVQSEGLQENTTYG